MTMSMPMTLCAVLLGALAITGCAAESDVGAGAAPTPMGTFAPVRGAPSPFVGVAGSVALSDGTAGGSDVSVALSGLVPNARYVSHLHAGTCEQPDPGGPHFKFDPDGPDVPPNEIHLELASNATGHATARVHSSRRISEGAAGSIVVHEDAPVSNSGAATGQAAAGRGQAHHGGGSTGTATHATGAHAHAAKVACAALREPGPAAAGPTPPPPQATAQPPLAIRISDNEPVGGVQQLTVRKGERMRFTVSSDAPEEVHVHDYDITEPVSPAAPARFDFASTIEGVFDVELQRSAVQILTLRVDPG